MNLQKSIFQNVRFQPVSDDNQTQLNILKQIPLLLYAIKNSHQHFDHNLNSQYKVNVKISEQNMQ